MMVFGGSSFGGGFTDIERYNRFLEERNEHMDTLCVSILALATAMMGGLLLILRSPAPVTDWGWNWAAILAVIVLVSTAAATSLYGVCILRGMQILANNSHFGKRRSFRGLRTLVVCLSTVVVIAVFLIVASTRFQVEPAIDQIPSTSGGGGHSRMTSR
jgi:hypothetical protein